MVIVVAIVGLLILIPLSRFLVRWPIIEQRMCQLTLATSARAPFLRRAFDWWLAQVKRALPPTIFFFVGFNLILWTKRLILEEHGVEFSGFFTATVAALLVGKAVLITDKLPFYAPLRRRANDPAHLVQECDLLAVRTDRVDILCELASPPVATLVRV